MSPAPSKTVLVVDDDDDVRQTIADALACQGYNILFARDGREALAMLSARETVDDLCVVLADVHMPRLDGPGLARAIRRDARLSHVRILVLSSSPEYGKDIADETMGKPFDLIALREAVERLCVGRPPTVSRPGRCSGTSSG